MKRISLSILVLIVVLTAFSPSCCAEMGSVDVDIWIQIENGGTAVIIAENNAPLPDPTRLVLYDNNPMSFHIVFSDPGEYTYMMHIEPDDRDLIFDTSVYRATIYITEINGVLQATIVVYDLTTGNKYAPWSTSDSTPFSVSFVNEERSEPTPTPTPTSTPSSSTTPDGGSGGAVNGGSGGGVDDGSSGGSGGGSSGGSGGGSSGSGSSGGQPQTGDDFGLNRYLLIAILSAAGLFLLSVLYYIDVDRQIKQRR